MRIVQVGSGRPHLQEGALSIFELCFQHNIKLEMEWVPRSANELADYMSHVRDFDDWMVNPSMFQYLDQLWGPHTVDCFANEHNSQTPRFHSRFWCPGSEAVDTFTVNWGSEVCWLVPPLYLVSRALCHARACKAQGTLIVPFWRSVPFWPLLCPDGRHLAPFIHAYEIFPYQTGMLQLGRGGNNLGDSLRWNSSLLAVAFNFSKPPRKFDVGFCLFNTDGVCDRCAVSCTRSS